MGSERLTGRFSMYFTCMAGLIGLAFLVSRVTGFEVNSENSGRALEMLCVLALGITLVEVVPAFLRRFIRDGFFRRALLLMVPVIGILVIIGAARPDLITENRLLIQILILITATGACAVARISLTRPGLWSEDGEQEDGEDK